MTRTAIAIRHVHFEDLGLLAPLLRARHYQSSYRDAAVDDLSAIDPAAPDLLVILGGPIGAFDETQYPFLAAELELIRRRLASRRPLLGICLGAQLIARALGAPVSAMPAKEIGFAPLSLTPDGQASVLDGLDMVPVLHWHGDRFGIPQGARHLAATALCPQQAFSWGETVLGLQFHLESDSAGIEHWLVGHASELAQCRIDPRTLRAQAAQWGGRLTQAATSVMTAWLEQAEAADRAR